MAILAVASSLVFSRYGRSIASYRVDSAARRVAQDLNTTKGWARARSQSKLITFTATGYSISGLRALDGTSMIYTVDLSKEPYRTTFRSIDFGGTTQCMFDGYGAPQTIGTVRLQSGEAVRTVSMDAAGNITIATN